MKNGILFVLLTALATAFKLPLHIHSKQFMVNGNFLFGRNINQVKSLNINMKSWNNVSIAILSTAVQSPAMKEAWSIIDALLDDCSKNSTSIQVHRVIVPETIHFPFVLNRLLRQHKHLDATLSIGELELNERNNVDCSSNVVEEEIMKVSMEANVPCSIRFIEQENVFLKESITRLLRGTLSMASWKKQGTITDSFQGNLMKNKSKRGAKLISFNMENMHQPCGTSNSNQDSCDAGFWHAPRNVGETKSTSHNRTFQYF